MADDTRPEALKDVAGLRGVVTGKAILDLKTRHERSNTEQTRKRATDAREFLNGDKKAPLPKNFFTVQGETDSFRSDPAISYERAMSTVQAAQSKWPFAKRNAMDFGADPEIVATQIETAINEVMRFRLGGQTLYPWPASVDVVAIEGRAALITVPVEAAWERCEPYADDKDEPLPKWQRDADGRGQNNSHYRDHPKTRSFEMDRKNTAKAYKSYSTQWKARVPPVRYRLLGPQEFVPIWNPDGSLKALIVEQSFRSSDLIREQWRWGPGPHLSPTGDTGGDTGTGGSGKDEDVKRLEYWGCDEDGTPYVSYAILEPGGIAHEAEKRDADGYISATVDLSPWCSRLPVSVADGLSWRGVRDKDKAPVPITHFTMQDHLNVATVKTGMVIAGWAYGFKSGWIERNPELGDVDTPPKDLTIEPLVYKEIDGKITHNDMTPFSPAIAQIVQMEQADASEASPSSGTGESASGFDRSLQVGFSERTQFAIKDGPRQLFEDAASFTLEIFCNWAEEYGPIPILTNPPQKGGKKERGRKSVVEFEADWAGGIYDMTAVFLPERGENPAQDQVNLEKVKQGLMTKLDYLEQAGIEDPAFYELQLKIEELEAAPFGQVDLVQTIAAMANNDRLEALAKAEKEQLLAKIAPGMTLEQALPAGFGAGVERPMPAMTAPETPGVPGVSIGNPVANSNAAAVQGFLNQAPAGRALAAGGAVPTPVGAPGTVA